MKLHEYQTKQLLARYNLPIPLGYICSTPRQAEEYAYKISAGPWVMKCQIHAGGRSKSSGVQIAKNIEEIRIFAKHWFGRRLITNQTDDKGYLVNKILIEAVINDIIQELYLGAVIDRSACRIVFIGSTKGGIEIEQVAEENPQLIHKIAIDPLAGPTTYQGFQLAYKLGLKGKLADQFSTIFMGLATIFLKYDLELLEINPLVITSQNNLICLDGKLSVDRNALFRQEDLCKMRDKSQEDAYEMQASQWKLHYIALNGNIACIANGAGLAMSTMDIIKLYGGEPANFLDLGGYVTKEHVIAAFNIILSNHNIKTILVNIFGGITCCDLIADGIIYAVEEMNINIPVITRLEGNCAVTAIQKITNSNLNIIIAKNLIDAIQQVVLAATSRAQCLF